MWVWFARNKLAHGFAAPSVQEITIAISREAKSHWLSLAQTGLGLDLSNKTWKPPPFDWIKVNVDAAFRDGCAQTGVVFRNCNGSIFHIASHKHHCQDPTSAESLAIMDACLELENTTFSNAIIESDCKNAITFIKVDALNCFWNASPIIERIRRFKKAWAQFRFLLCF
ncbi:hypothetical protein CASFOL_029463 [Castilleja foliolosa]|uniref:RNase H type-1 domain-containing protein n=1 Tax=Castilleja foliolosa TaxID=1961234 RepID=A0ABD3CA60_9LAMI